MNKKPTLYKTLVVGVTVLLILTCYSVIPGISAPNNTKNCGWVPPDNKPPEAPTIDGPANVKPGVELCWTFQSIDPDDDDVMYIIDWGDETSDETNYIQSDTPVEACHIYKEKDAYLIRARAIDIYGYKGEWSTYYIPKNEDDCKICQPVSKPYSVLIKSLLIRLEKYDIQLLELSKQYPEYEKKYEELSSYFNSDDPKSIRPLCIFLGILRYLFMDLAEYFMEKIVHFLPGPPTLPFYIISFITCTMISLFIDIIGTFIFCWNGPPFSNIINNLIID